MRRCPHCQKPIAAKPALRAEKAVARKLRGEEPELHGNATGGLL
jgi:hypothetical protein